MLNPGLFLVSRAQTFAALPTHSSPLPDLESIHLVETSNPLRSQQVDRVRKRLEGGRLKAEGEGAGVGRKRLIVRDPEHEHEEGNDRTKVRGRDEVELSFHEWIGKVPVGQSVGRRHRVL
jgi:hypothetical protein